MSPQDPIARLSAETRDELRRIDAALDQARAARAEQGDDEHDPEEATAADDWSRLTGLRRAAEARLGELRRADERRSAGLHGVCAGCGRPIDPARLAARPEAGRCRDCAARHERRAR